MTDQIDENPIRVQVVEGAATFEAATKVQLRLLSDAGLPKDAPLEAPAGPRTAFHVASLYDGRAVGALLSVIGSFEELSIAAYSHPGEELPGQVCEATALSVSPEVAGLGVSELLYRSVYRHAQAHGARSLAAMVPLLNADFLRNEYGLPLRNLGPVQDHFGVDMVAVGATIEEIQRGAVSGSPAFVAFLTEDEPEGEGQGPRGVTPRSRPR